MLSRILAFTLLISVPAIADDCSPSAIDQNVIRSLSRVASRLKVECPHSIDAQEVCSAVNNQTMEMDPFHDTIAYTYQTKIFKAACVEAGDSEETVRAKVQNFWNKYHDSITCSTVNFNPRNGNILKLAVARKSDPFIDDVLVSWKLGLNHVDSVDQMTVLDYIEKRRSETPRGTAHYRVYDLYYTRFKAAGAKHRREL